MQDVVQGRRRVSGLAHPDTRRVEYRLSYIRGALVAATAIQARVRGILARRRLAAEHAAAVVLQTLARAHA